ncbi:hypothetical protein LX77_03854 [Gelidibacter algens]|uniref:Uncharacterized protein n=1 Tax=Gelidibacter algens TaxID=49280 RepID=A0A327RPJ5_9FLAO|nr:hypothetical protein [Gelidibacter algens]RAJ17544.1 hypothetical protein LX77_03854 [Gelidibacter algens]
MTRDRKDNYPAYQKYLDENTMTLHEADKSDVEVIIETFKNYLSSLKELVKKFKKAQ